MKNIKSTLIAVTMGVIGFASISISADTSDEREVRIEIHKNNDDNAKVDINVNGNAEVFSLPSLEVGETRDIVTESGNTISVTKTESGMSLLIDGEEIDLPSVGAEMSAHFMKGGMPLHHASNDGIQVIGDLTDEQIAIIKDGFAAAGVEKKINFTKGNEMKFFFSGDDADLPQVRKWLNKDGDDVKIIKLGNGDKQSFDIQFNSSDAGSWISENGNNVKIIKFGDDEGEIKVGTKMLIIHAEDK